MIEAQNAVVVEAPGEPLSLTMYAADPDLTPRRRLGRAAT